MHLSKIKIKNFRLLHNVELNVDLQTTLIVGRNNTAKTSSMHFILKALKNQDLSYDDYPLSLRKYVSKLLYSFYKNERTFETFVKKLPIPELTFYVDYSAENDEQNLGALSPFIIDVDSSQTTVIIKAKYSFIADEKSLRELLDAHRNKSVHEDIVEFDRSALKDDIYKKFSKFFQLQIVAIDPNNKEHFQIKKQAELQNLFPIYSILAERSLDESGEKQTNTLTPLIRSFFAKNCEDLNKDIVDEVEKLKTVVDKANKETQKHTNNILSGILVKSRGFGYPNAEDLRLNVRTRLDLQSQVQNLSELTYSSRNSDEELPSGYNGLGYKNLIKIQFELASFADEIKDCSHSCIPLLFIEEPESHMHPQMQQAFIAYLESFLAKLTGEVKVQTFITSHSAHVASAVDFRKIRYAQKHRNSVIYKDLNDFTNKELKNLDFIQKYLTLTKCDLFFTDKAIFVEGAAERLLIPDMIKKCENNTSFASKLSEQYYTTIEIGGAYAYIFIPLMEFLGIPSLILTDIDPAKKECKADKNGVMRTTTSSSEIVSKGSTTTNETIKYWLRRLNIIESEEIVPLESITSLSNSEKTIGKIHIEFQSKEQGFIAPSLEEAIRNVNRSFYGLDENIQEEEDLLFKEKSKTNFALKLIYENPNYEIPEYIRNGLLWLSEEPVLI